MRSESFEKFPGTFKPVDEILFMDEVNKMSLCLPLKKEKRIKFLLGNYQK
jgi:hypothetical protein